MKSGYAQNHAYLDGTGWKPHPILSPKNFASEYRNRFNECEPHETLFYYLYDCASNYGREATEVEFSKYGNMFTCGLFFYRGYFFNRMNGQGTVIHITKET